MNSVRRYGLVIILSLGWSVGFVDAATFTVTSGSCVGPGSIVEAIGLANNTAGDDTITFTQDLIININNGSSCGIVTTNPSEFYMAKVTENVTFEGNNASIVGSPLWVTADGQTNIIDSCPSQIPGTTIVREVPGFLRIDNGVSVEVRDMTFSKMSALVEVSEDASFTLKDSKVVEVIDWFSNCDRHPIDAIAPNGSVSLYNSEITLSHAVSTDVTFGNGIILWSGAAISGVGVGGTLNVVESIFDGVLASIQWKGTANIVSSRFVDSGWINVIGGTLNIVNSSFNGGLAANTDYLQIYAATGFSTDTVDVNIQASTFYAPVYDCHSNSGCLQEDLLGALIAKGNGNGHVTFNVKESAIGVGIPDFNTDKLININSSSSITVDALTWMQPVAGQDTAALKLATGQPLLLTDPPGLPVDPFAAWPNSATPLLGTQATPGVLIDAIPNAGSGQANELRSPIDNSVITIDALGSPRVDGNSTRTIGAIQVTLAPHTAVTSTTESGALVSWSRPKDPDPAKPITGYGVIYEPTDGSEAPIRIDVTGPDTTNLQLTGLTAGKEYRVTVVGVNSDGDGPPSNIVQFQTQSPSLAPNAVPTISGLGLIVLCMLVFMVAIRHRRLAI